MRFQRIVIGMDFSDAAVTAATWTARAFAPGAELILVHAIELPNRPRFARDHLPASQAIERAARDFAEHRLAELLPRLESKAVRSDIRVGRPSDLVLDVVRETNADLVVIGPHGDRPRPMHFLGSAADRIVRQSPVPVLIAIDPPSAAPTTLLVPVDEADITRPLLALVGPLADAFGATVTLVHVWSNALYSHVASASHATARSEGAAQREIRAELDADAARWLEEMSRAGLPARRVTASVAHGNAGDEILTMASTIGADLIVMGRRGAGLVAPALLGSTAGTVLHGAGCPVLVITENIAEATRRA